MIKGWIFLTAQRYLLTRRKEKGHVAFIFSVAGISVGVMTLIVVLSVMNGFQQGFISNLNEISSYHIRIQTDQPLPPEQQEKLLSWQGISSIALFSDTQTVLQAEFADPQGALIRAMDFDGYLTDLSLQRHLEVVSGRFNLEKNGGIILGSELARNLRLLAGDTVSLMTISRDDGGRLIPRTVDFTLTGIFKSGYYDIDSSMGYISMEDGQNLLSTDGYTYGLKIKNHFHDRRFSSRIRKYMESSAIQAEITTWRDYNRAFFSALLMEKLMMIFVVGLVFIVVAVNLFQSLKRSVLERMEELALLKAVGARPSQIRMIFVLEGVIISLLGGLGGLVLGLLLSYNVNSLFAVIEKVGNSILALFKQEELTLYSSSFFYLTEVPVLVMGKDIIAVFALAVGTSVLAAFGASRKVSIVKPAEVLRYE